MRKAFFTRFKGGILGASALLVLGGTCLIWWKTLPVYNLINDSSREIVFSLSIKGERKDIELQPHESLSIRYTGDKLPEKISFWPLAEFGPGCTPGESGRRGTIDFNERRIGLGGATGTLQKWGVCDTHLSIMYQEPPLSAPKGPVLVHIVHSASRENLIAEDKTTIPLGFIVYRVTGQGEWEGYFKDAGWVGEKFEQ